MPLQIDVSTESAVPGLTAAEVSDETATVPKDDGLVQQHFKDEVDINTIVRRFGITSEMPFGPKTGVYGDFTGILDYDGALARIEGAQERFMALPAEVREKFNNDAGHLIRMAQTMPEAEFEQFLQPRDAAGRFEAADKPAS